MAAPEVAHLATRCAGACMSCTCAVVTRSTRSMERHCVSAARRRRTRFICAHLGQPHTLRSNLRDDLAARRDIFRALSYLGGPAMRFAAILQWRCRRMGLGCRADRRLGGEVLGGSLFCALAQVCVLGGSGRDACELGGRTWP